ncbi:cysteine--tRNA ligase [Conexibacter woesei]|uniref:cysteine--tRNA ligase n=1 Tax=Conexibacter woesei TaxID=191495 RepID=UPI000404F25D|nr:cysteine--tRNA ligase [Conexibacter woesei]
MPEIRLHDTRSGQLKPLVAREPGNRVGIYACGPTVYNRIHVGNARPFVVFSWLKRFLAHEGYDVTFVANVTDVNDKIYDAARAAGVGSEELAVEMTEHYRADTEALGLGRPDHEPLASETIDGIVALIQALLDRDAAYAVEGDVYFRVRSDDAYGTLSHRHLDDLDQGEGVEGIALKEDPLDFALWKAQKEGEDTAWDTPWGRGRPGWHIECSAMAEDLLGVGFEIHGGGSDLVFPHHENEAAQTRLGRGEELAQIWMHNGMLEMRGEKMSKSLGNISLLPEVLDEWGRETLLLFFASGHYHQPIVFAPDTLRDAQGRLKRIREAGRRLVDGPSPAALREHRDAFFTALADDFNTAGALAALAAWVSDANKLEDVGRDDLVEMLDIFGLAELAAPDAGDGPPPEALELLAARESARAGKDWAEADRLRDELAASGWIVRDGANGAELVPA